MRDGVNYERAAMRAEGNYDGLDETTSENERKEPRVEYRVRPVIRYLVTKYDRTNEQNHISSVVGEFHTDTAAGEACLALEERYERIPRLPTQTQLVEMANPWRGGK